MKNVAIAAAAALSVAVLGVTTMSATAHKHPGHTHHWSNYAGCLKFKGKAWGLTKKGACKRAEKRMNASLARWSKKKKPHHVHSGPTRHHMHGKTCVAKKKVCYH